MHQKQEPVSAQTLVKAKMASVRSSWIKGAFIDRLVFARVVWRMDTSFTSPLLSLLTQLSIPCITHFGVGFSPPIVLLKARKKSQFQGTFFKKYAQRFQNPQSLIENAGFPSPQKSAGVPCQAFESVRQTNPGTEGLRANASALLKIGTSFD